MPGQRRQYELESQQQVTLVEWNGIAPTQHSQALRDRPWSQDVDRSELRFYESTNEYMRNDWAFSKMPNAHVSIGNSHAVLFYHGMTDSWHTTDALDIDHRVEWKPYLEQRGVANMAEANMAYNDVDNLRMLPGSYNRARDVVDRLHADRAQNPAARDTWRTSNFGYDPLHPPRDYDPVADRAQRNALTQGQDYDPEQGRRGLSFDKKIADVWFESQLKTLYAGSVEVPKGGDASNGVEQVPLFRCPETRQLVTRDAFDIDHVHPISEVLREKIEESQHGTISKAEALDAYNDVGNLRLIVRSANSSHEWELDRDGEFADFGQGTRLGRGAGTSGGDDQSLRDFIEEDDIDSPGNRQAFEAMREHIGRDPSPQPLRDPDAPVNMLQPRRPNAAVEDDDRVSQGSNKRPRLEADQNPSRAFGAAVFPDASQMLGPTYADGDPRRPNDPGHADYQKVKAAVDASGQYTAPQAENIAVAAYLSAAADRTIQRFDDVRVNDGVVSVSYVPYGTDRQPIFSHHTQIADVQDKPVGQSLQEARVLTQSQALQPQPQPSDPQIGAISQPAGPRL
jgi:hypothetical protein